jgi:L-aspartate oxidase
MDKYRKVWRDLAPRDIVARAIYTEMLNGGKNNVYLDLKSYISKERILKHFPNLYKECLKYGIDLTQDLVPVVPAAHYHCGGIWVDENGATTIRNLYAVGEVSCTGLHGANRLASTSLLEGLTWGFRAAREINRNKNTDIPKASFIPSWIDQGKDDPDPALINQDTNLIRQIMWNCVGLVRNKERLTRAKADLSYLNHRIENFYQEKNLTESLIGLRNIVLVGSLIADAAWENKVSAGCHFRTN